LREGLQTQQQHLKRPLCTLSQQENGCVNDDDDDDDENKMIKEEVEEEEFPSSEVQSTSQKSDQAQLSSGTAILATPPATDTEIK
jgi:hypothetical protein